MQTISVPNKSVALPFAFLSSPPSAPARRRSNSAITTWVAHVQPGSPAPRSPRRRPSTSSQRRPSVVARRPSVSFITLIDTPTTGSAKDFDLTNLGYSSVFVHFPATPSTPSPFLPKSAAAIPVPVPVSPTTTKPRRTLNHFRSLSALTRRAKSPMPVPAVPALPPSSPTKSKSITKRKKAQYNTVKPRAAAPPLANELAMMQFADGGSLESHAKRVMAHQARQAGAGVGVGAVWRDAQGGLWWDEDEEWEYMHLLQGAAPNTTGNGWVQFEKEELERRGSVSTQDSDLDARHAVQPAEDEHAFVPRALRRRPDVRPRPAHEFLLDAAAFGAPSHAKSPSATTTTTSTTTTKAKGPARRRPAPLKLARPHAHAHHAPHTADSRVDFLAASFAPAPPVPSLAPCLFPPSAAPLSPLSPTSPVPRRRRTSVSGASVAPSTKGRAGVMRLFRRRE
ncbi:hypothetical protein C8J57DRAFT_1392544 [Mycena rebaudengoi]|nr:hypothetical protein C8J57DRAFT_1392544 [Mycena rebaudengoi]